MSIGYFLEKSVFCQRIFALVAKTYNEQKYFYINVSVNASKVKIVTKFYLTTIIINLSTVHVNVILESFYNFTIKI